MDTVILVFSIVLFRLFLFVVGKKTLQNSRNLLLFIVFLTVVACSLPLVLLKKEVLESSAINVLIAGVSFFYFPFVVGRMSKNDRERAFL